MEPRYVIISLFYALVTSILLLLSVVNAVVTINTDIFRLVIAPV
jgi:hypothetical protein